MTVGVIIGIVVGSIILLSIIIYLISRIRIVKQTDKYIVERLGGYLTTWDTGFHYLCPFIDRVARVVSMKEQVKDFAPQPVITKDNVTMMIDTVVFYTILDAKLYVYGVDNPIFAIESLTATTLRNIIGDLELDTTLTSRDIINDKMRSELDNATDPWGIKVNRVEVKNILPPRDIQDSMERQMRAERERREKILLAEGEKKSKILQAEGDKESQILRAEAEKEAQILRAEAEKQTLIKQAEGQAESILKIKQAEADGIKLVREAEAEGIKSLKNTEPSKEVLTMLSYESMEKVAQGNATKIIVPSDMQNLAATITSVSEMIKK